MKKTYHTETVVYIALFNIEKKLKEAIREKRRRNSFS